MLGQDKNSGYNEGFNWEFYQPRSVAERLAVRPSNGVDEMELLRRIMNEERGKYPSLILPENNLGADIVMLGSRSEELGVSETTSSSSRKRWLLVKVQAKAQAKSGPTMARLSLEYPYGINRGEPPKERKDFQSDGAFERYKTSKESSDAKMKLFRDIEKECVVVHVLCVTDKKKHARTAKRTVDGQEFVEIVIDSTVWENDKDLSVLRAGAAGIVDYKVKSAAKS